MDIDGLGEEVVDLLLDSKMIQSYADLYRLQEEEVASLVWPKMRKGKDGKQIEVQFGQLNAKKLIDGIDATRERGLSRLLASLSIRHVGPRVAKLICRTFPNLEGLLEATVQELADIHEIGQAIAESVHSFCHSEHGVAILKDLESVGVSTSESVPTENMDSAIAGKTIVVTGTLQQLTRDRVKALIEEMGGRASSSVSKKTDFLLAGDKAGSKLAKAKALGVQILSEDDFQKFVDLFHRG